MILRTAIYSLKIILICLCWSCAKQTSPTGGPKDEAPPILLESTPKNKALNFKGKTVELYFDEAIIANNPRDQVIITPSIEGDFEMLANKKKVTIKFESDFSDSTTYTINFRESIQDITEKNPAENLQLAFSTGPYIDSLSINGRVFNLLEGTPTDDATVALYHNPDTFNIFEHKPVYITKTRENGVFLFENLKPGIYFIYAFFDRNKNLLVDSRTEMYGFRKDSIKLASNTDSLFIPIIKLDARPLKVTSARPYSNYFNIKTNKTINSYSIRSNSDTSDLVHSFGEDNLNIRLYNTIGERDSIDIKLIAKDSIGNEIDTVLFAKFSKREVTPEKLSYTVKKPSILTDKGHFSASINFNKPIISINFDSLFIIADSSNFIPITPQDVNWDPSINELTVQKEVNKELFAPKEELPSNRGARNKPLPSDTAEIKGKPKLPQNLNLFFLDDGAFISIDNDSSKRIQEKISVLKPENLGVIISEIQTETTQYITELLDKNFNLIKSFRNTKKDYFTNLSPADYQLRLIIDLNGNGKWDPGNYLNKEEPEPIAFYHNESGSKIISIKANWELGPLFITY